MKWSISAHNTFRRCQRQFFFGNIMASHNAKDPRRREAFILKQLKHLPVWRGVLVHDCLNNFFIPSVKNGLISQVELTRITLELLDQQYEFSKNRRYRSGLSKSEHGSYYCALYEHEFGKSIEDKRLEIIRNEISQCYEYLYSITDFLMRLRNCENLTSEIILPFKVDSTTISGKLDLTFIDETNLNIVDWKIGASDTSDYSMQLLIYALAATHRMGRRPERIRLYEVNLLKKRINEHAIDEERLQKAEDFIYRSISDIKSVTRELKYDDLKYDDFESTQNPTNCEFCNYQKFCTEISDEK